MQLRTIKLLAGPLLGVFVALLLQRFQTLELSMTAGVGVWMAVWWTTEAVSIYVTAFLPVVLFPFLGIIDMKTVAREYLPDINFLFLGGFIIAFALEKWNLHKRIALRIILATGSSPTRILLGFMLTSYLLSMWMLNTSTVLMLLPAVLAVVAQLEAQHGKEAKKPATAYLLGLAFASSIGGTATLVGTAPNLVFMQYFNTNLPGETPVSFSSWFLFGLPVSLVFFFICYFVLRWIFFRKHSHVKADVSYCREEYARLGGVTYEEKALGVVFILTVLLWFTSKDLSIGDWKIQGWVSQLGWIEGKGFIKESTIAMLMAMLLFVIPAGKGNGPALMTWKDAQKVPFGILFLFGAGFALAKAVDVSELDAWLSLKLQGVGSLNPILLVGGLCLFMTFFTELTSNTASTVLMMPVLFEISRNTEVSPYLLMMPVVFSASFAFMLPVATPPNTIVFGSEKVAVRDMMRAGIWLNLIGVVIITAFAFTLGQWLYG